MFKELFKTTISLIIKPSIAWQELNARHTENNDKFLSDYVYPFIGMIVAAAFLGELISLKAFDLQIALKSAILDVISYFGGFFLASYLICETLARFFHREHNMSLCQRFTGYSSSLMFAITIFLKLIPEFFFLQFVLIYTFYIVWEGARQYMDIDEAEQLKFVTISTIIIVITPKILAFVVGFIIPGLR